MLCFSCLINLVKQISKHHLVKQSSYSHRVVNTILSVPVRAKMACFPSAVESSLVYVMYTHDQQRAGWGVRERKLVL